MTTASQPVSKAPMRHQVTLQILTGIFQGTFRPGEHLVVQRLCELFRTSPTPVRESMVELANLRMVELLPNRGAVVRSFGPKQVREISQIRRLLEVEATRCACGRIAPEELSAIERELERLQTLDRDTSWDRDGRAVDTRLHGLIAASCGNERLTDEIGRYLTLFRTLRDVSHRRDAKTNYSHIVDVPEHLAIVRALLRGDAEGAASAMAEHVRSAAEALERGIFGAGPSANGIVSP
jgi:DNA-binding GntR family transcriptional regulator